MKKNKGFTFVELLVVITIIAVVFAAGVVSYTSISKNSRNARRKADIEAIRQALEMCRSISGNYPGSIYDSVQCDNKVPPTVTMKSTPLDPKTCNASDKYAYAPVGSGYTLSTNCMEPGPYSYSVTNP